MSLPNLFVIGAARSGTTSLYRYLSRHPDVYVPKKKELDFLGVGEKGQIYDGPDKSVINSRITRTWEEYTRHYDDVIDENFSADISPWYLYSTDSARSIRDNTRDSKIIAILRNPVERVFSHYRLMRMLGLETEVDFRNALEAEEDRIKNNWSFGWFYREVGYYGSQLSRYYSVFSKEAIKVVLFEDLQKNPALVMQDIYEYLGISHEVDVRYDISNAAVLPRLSVIEKALKWNNPMKSPMMIFVGSENRKKLRAQVEKWNTFKPRIDRETSDYLNIIYKRDKELLENLLGRRIDSWET